MAQFKYQPPPQPPPAPVKPEIVTGVDLVRAGHSVVAAATMAGITMSALRTACARAGVVCPKDSRSDILRRARQASRDADIAYRWSHKQPLEQICRDLSVTPTLIKRVVREVLGKEIDVPKRHKNTRAKSLTVLQLRGDVAVEDLLRRREAGAAVSVSAIARFHNLNRHIVEEALTRRLRRESAIDDNTVVGDTLVASDQAE